MSSMNFAEALNEARTLILQQSKRIKNDAEKLEIQANTLEAQSGEIDSLMAQMAQVQEDLKTCQHNLESCESSFRNEVNAREQAEATAGRQRIHIEQMEHALDQKRRLIDEQAEAIARLTKECESLRCELPSDDDISALTALNSLLATKPERRSEARPARAPQWQPEPQVETQQPEPVAQADEPAATDEESSESYSPFRSEGRIAEAA